MSETMHWCPPVGERSPSQPSPPLDALASPPSSSRQHHHRRRYSQQPHQPRHQPQRQQYDAVRAWNGGLLCCAALAGELHCLLGVEYRESSRLNAHERKAASHRKPTNHKRVLQLVVPGGRHKPGETSADTTVREFWEESGRIVDCDALRQCLMHRGSTFEFDKSRYRLTVAVDAVHPTITDAFCRRVAQCGYPDECCVQLHWIPWRVLRETAWRRDLVALRSTIEPLESRTPVSAFARMALVQDSRVRRYLDSMQAHVWTRAAANGSLTTPRRCVDTAAARSNEEVQQPRSTVAAV